MSAEARKLSKISRREFLQTALLLSAGSLLAACSQPPEGVKTEATLYVSPTPASVLPSPLSPESQPVDSTPEPEGLDEFLRLSAILTGVQDLNPVLGQVYLNSLQSAGVNLEPLYAGAEIQSATPQTLPALTEGGFFNQEETGSTADRIITMWYTGIYEQDGESRVATFVDALMWKAIAYTKPLTICSSFGFWADEPTGSY